MDRPPLHRVLGGHVVELAREQAAVLGVVVQGRDVDRGADQAIGAEPRRRSVVGRAAAAVAAAAEERGDRRDGEEELSRADRDRKAALGDETGFHGLLLRIPCPSTRYQAGVAGTQFDSDGRNDGLSNAKAQRTRRPRRGDANGRRHRQLPA
jgi:hypothetical protein